MEISVPQAAQRARLTRAGIIKAIKLGHLPAKRSGRCFRIDEADLAHFQAHRPKRGRPNQTDIRAKDKLLALAQTPPRSLGLDKWTLCFLKEALQASGFSLSTGTISAVLNDAGLRNLVLTSPRGRRKTPRQPASQNP